MFWILRSCHRTPKGLSRNFSFTPNQRLPRSLPPHAAPHGTPRPAAHGITAYLYEVKPFAQEVRPPSARRQIIFFIVGSLVTYGVAARLTNVDTYNWTNRLTQSGITWAFRTPGNDELRKAKYHELGKKLQAGLVRVGEALAALPRDIQSLAVYTYAQVAQSALNTTEGRRICYAIGAVNGLVWLAWRVPSWNTFMMRSFTHNPLSGLSYTMLTCVFSHASFIHLLFNTMALTSFGASASYFLTSRQQNDPHNLRESTTQWHFLAFFVAAGLFSSLVSHAVTARITYPKVLAQLSRPTSSATAASTAAGSAAEGAASSSITKISDVIKPSLGASGAIYATVTLTAMAFPDSHVSLIFPPTPPIPIQYGVFGLMAVDVLGIIRGWRMFDHYAHLGGAVFGLWYYRYGADVWEFFRERTLGALPRSLRKE